MKKQPTSPPAVKPSPCLRPQVMNHSRLLAPSLASAVVLLAAIGLSRELLLHQSPTIQTTQSRQRSSSEAQKGPASAPSPGRFGDGAINPEDPVPVDKPQSLVIAGPDESFDRQDDGPSYFGEQRAGERDREIDRLQSNDLRDFGAGTESLPAAEVEAANTAQPLAPAKRENIRLAKPSVNAQLVNEEPAEEIRQRRFREKADLKDGDFSREVNEPADLEYDEFKQGRKVAKGKIASEKVNSPRLELPEFENLGRSAIGGAFGHAGIGFDFLGHYQHSENLHFQPATGYWANTYIPGDPEIRLLSARLGQWDRTWLANSSLEQDVEPLHQPFDAPANNALALSLMADTNAISTDDDGATRMRVQVGIRGIEHRRGQRPAMNVGVVVDLPPEAPDEVRIATRALLDAMLQSKQAGDHFSLVMTGSGLVVEAADFRFGSLQLAKQHILGQDPQPEITSANPPKFELQAALQRAAMLVQQTDDPSRPLGSSSVLLISASTLSEVEQLAALAHEQAKQGITLSVFPLGNRPQSESVEKLVLAGLGNRRYLEAPGQARQLIEEELHASSRAVARAARLSVRLAPGVRLVNVVGSERLDTRRSQRVREIENSMDRRLSANLGIRSDRGEDEDGIQIVIPSIFSGDSVTVLLDVVADQPGAIADVSLRYKDLVFLGNGSLQGHLDLPGGPLKRGPAELSVLKNLLSHHFIDAVEQAAEALGRQQAGQAIAALEAMLGTIEQARQDLPAWANDPDLIRDQQVLDRYIAALAMPQAGAHQSFLTDSLRYAAWAKTHRPLKEWNQ